MRSHPAYRPLDFPGFVVAASGDDRQSLPTLIEISYAFYRIIDRYDFSWRESRPSISFPEIAHFFRSDTAPES